MPIDSRRILFHDSHFLAVNKLSGELVVKGKGKVGKLPLLDFLRKQYPGLRPVNRLDFETSGIVLFAQSKGALEKAMEMPTKKTYLTIVRGRVKPLQGEIRKPLPARSGKGEVPALTRYQVLGQFRDFALVECTIESGRHHQIRRHLASIGHPLLLDDIYGDKTFNHRWGQKLRMHRFFLHAAALFFHHPFTREWINVEAPVPRAFEDVLRRLSE